MARIIGGLVTAGLLTAGTASAQLPGLEPGARVRIHVAGASMPVTGTVAYRDGSQVALLRSAADTAIVPLAEIRQVDVSSGRRSNVLRGARLGALIGAGAGAIIGIAAMSDDGGFIDFGAEAIPIGMVGFGLFGGTAGLLIGSTSSYERWEPLPAAITIAPGGSEVAVSVRFSF